MTVLTPSRPRSRSAGDESGELRLWPASPESAPGVSPAEGTTAREPAAQPAAAVPDGPTLEALVTRVWEGLSAHAPVACPVCAGELRPRYGAGTGVVGGRCGGCGSELS